jgi:hypothetical protein
VLRSLKPAGLVTDEAPSMFRRNSGVSLLITNDAKNTMNRDLIIFHCLIDQGNLSV